MRKYRRIGFTGTQEGTTDIQRRLFELLYRHLARSSETEFHHGDCIGADEQADFIVSTLGAYRVSHPASNANKRAWTKADEERKPKPYLERNRDIVADTQVLIAMPKGKEELRSGTWATIRYARKAGKPIYIIYPNGAVHIENDE